MQPKFLGNHLNWDVDRPAKPFRVFVVEPDIYDPKLHASIFDAALSALTTTSVEPLDRFKKAATPRLPEHFDLVTFPEAFLPADHLSPILTAIANAPSLGCVHVGLRPDTLEDQHLFSVDQLQKLIVSLRALPALELTDLEPFESWLNIQQTNHLFNVGCLFTVDINQAVRVCLHPKLVRSKFERSTLPERHMEEANLLTLVTLHPSNKMFKTVTLQPLLCSDALELPTDRGNGGPLDAVNRDACLVSQRPPDNIDIVSVASCTPQVEVSSPKGHTFFTWHPEFKGTFIRAATKEALSRHHRSTFVLSNFAVLSSGTIGGLSGAFVPVSLQPSTYEKFIGLSCWGRPNAQAVNTWSPDDEGYETAISWQNRGYLFYLARSETQASPTGRMFGFTVDPLPRDTNSWGDQTTVTKCIQMVGVPGPAATDMKFSGV